MVDQHQDYIVQYLLLSSLSLQSSCIEHNNYNIGGVFSICFHLIRTDDTVTADDDTERRLSTEFITALSKKRHIDVYAHTHNYNIYYLTNAKINIGRKSAI